MAWSNNQAAFATFLILCPTSFFLGILFSLFPYDYPLLWTAEATPTAAFAQLEGHLTLLFNSPPLIARIFHIVIATGLLGFFIKLYRPSESNMLFDGASLALYVIAIIVYLTNTVRGMRVIDEKNYDVEIVEGETVVGKTGWQTGLGGDQEGIGPDALGREDSLKVLAASNTILALVLVGVLVLQAGQWYAERKQRQEEDEIRKEKAEKAAERTKSGTGSSAREHRSPAASKKKV